MINYTENDQNKDGLKFFRLRKFYMREFIYKFYLHESSTHLVIVISDVCTRNTNN